MDEALSDRVGILLDKFGEMLGAHCFFSSLGENVFGFLVVNWDAVDFVRYSASNSCTF
jgi:hypothetical protein